MLKKKKKTRMATMAFVSNAHVSMPSPSEKKNVFLCFARISF